MNLEEKLDILGGAARYDASCASSGPGNAGVCHSWSDDGRCISLLKVLFTNHCIYDCAYCANRRTNETPRAAFTVAELVRLTVEFYRRNYIEGLFLSSGVFRNPDATMEALVDVARTLRGPGGFRGYIHLKAIPGADPALVRAAGLYADRLSVNIELPSRESLAALAPDKTPEAIFAPMKQIAGEAQNALEVAERAPGGLVRRAPGGGLARPAPPRFAPAGQSTQMIVGATPESDLDILRLSRKLYTGYRLKRVYYSAYLPVNDDRRLPALAGPPLGREHRLYQSDWLYRFYGFDPDELLSEAQPWLDPDLDPKASWALRHPEAFPVDVNRAPGAQLLRVPGLGPRVLDRVLRARRAGRLRRDDLAVLGVRLAKAGPFLVCEGEGGPGGRPPVPEPGALRRLLLDPAARRREDRAGDPGQLELFP